MILYRYVNNIKGIFLILLGNRPFNMMLEFHQIVDGDKEWVYAKTAVFLERTKN